MQMASLHELIWKLMSDVLLSFLRKGPAIRRARECQNMQPDLGLNLTLPDPTTGVDMTNA